MIMSNPIISARNMMPQADMDDVEMLPLSLDIMPRSVTCFIGPDSAMKTSYLRTLAGVDIPKKGELILLGKNVKELSQSEWHESRKKIGFVAENTPLISFYSAWRNVIFPALYHNLAGPQEVEGWARELVDEIGVEGDLEQLPAYIERFQKYKLAIVRALILKPEVLFLDESLKHLDVHETETLKEFLLKLKNERQMAMVVSTLDMPFVFEKADTIVFVSQKSLHIFESSEELAESDIPEVQQFLKTHARWQHYEKAQ